MRGGRASGRTPSPRPLISQIPTRDLRGEWSRVGGGGFPASANSDAAPGRSFPEASSAHGIICQLLDQAVVERSRCQRAMSSSPTIRRSSSSALVASGRYQNASEVLREGLRLLESREAEEKVRLKALREAARIGVADIDAGRFRGFESRAALGRHLAAVADKVISGRGSGTRGK